MRCTNCGAELEAGARFCPTCGAEVVETRGRAETGEVAGAAPAGGPGAYRGSPTAPWNYASAPAAAGRVTRHLRPLATLWLVYAVLRAATGVMGLLVVTAIGRHHYGPLPWVLGTPLPGYLHSEMWMGFAAPAIIVSTLLGFGLALATGLGLQQRWRGGRILALIAGVLVLFKFPLGTALGVYTLWVLAPPSSGAEYDAVAASAVAER